MQSSSFEIKNCIVLCGPQLEPFHCKSLRCEDGVIQRLEKLSPANDLSEKRPIILPGLINGHTHIGDSFLPDGATGLTLEEGFFRPNGYKYRQLDQIEHDEHVQRITESLQYMAATGTVAHFDFREQGPEGSNRLREASRKTGVDSIILGQINEIPFNDAALKANRDGLSAAAEEEYHRLMEVADGVSESTINDLTDPSWNWLKEETQKRGKLRAIHCLENAGYRETSLSISGRGDLERALDVYGPHLVVHLTVANQKEIQRLADSNAVAVLNPRANTLLGLPIPPVRDLIESGVPLLLGTDNGLLNSQNMFAELDFTYKVAKSQYGNAVDPDPSVILKMATSNVAHLGMPGHCGFLDEGQPATFVVVDGSRPHLRHSRHIIATLITRVTPGDILATVLRGECLFGQLPSNQ